MLYSTGSIQRQNTIFCKILHELFVQSFSKSSFLSLAWSRGLKMIIEFLLYARHCAVLHAYISLNPCNLSLKYRYCYHFNFTNEKIAGWKEEVICPTPRISNSVETEIENLHFQQVSR